MRVPTFPCRNCGGSGRQTDDEKATIKAGRYVARHKLQWQALAKRLGISQSLMSLLRYGKRHWTERTLEKLARLTK